MPQILSENTILSRNLRTALIAGLICANLLVFALSGYSLYQSRKQYELRAQTLTQNISSALDRSLSSSIEKIDLTLSTVVDELERQLAGKGIGAPAMNVFLDRQARRLPEVVALRATDADGLLILGNPRGEDERVSAAERDFFPHHRDHADGALRVSKPFVGKVLNKHLLTFTRRYSHPDGRFAGVVIAAISLDHLTHLLSRFDLGPKGTIILRDTDLGLITRYPPIPDSPAGQVGNSAVSKTGRQLSESRLAVATYHTPAGSDGLERIYTLRRLEKAPMIVNAGAAREDYLADWTIEAYQTGAMAFGFLLLSLGSGGLLLHLFRETDGRQKLLRQSEERLRAITDTATAVIFMKDLQGRYLHVNRLFEQLFHVTNVQAQGKTDYDLFARDMANAFTRNDQLVVQTERQIEVEELVQQDDGLHTYSSVKFPLRNSSGEIYAVCGIATDITPSKQAEAARESLQEQLRESNDTYRSILATSHDGFWQVDRGGRLIDVNASYCRLSGYSRDELLGMRIAELEASEADSAGRDRRIEESGSAQYESAHRRKDGSVWNVEVSASYSPGRGGQFFAFLRDITERKHAENALKTSEDRFRRAFYVNPDSININRLEDGLYVSVNRGFTLMTGYTEDDVIGRTSTELNIWDDPQDRVRLVQGLSKDGVVPNLEARFRAKDGTIRHGLMSAAVIEIEGIPHLISITRDMTERRKADEARAQLETQLRESQKMEALGTLAGGVAHDFNNIVAAILGNVELARQDVAPSDAVLQSLEEIRRASLRAKALVQQILSFGRRQAIERKVVSLVPVVEESVRLLRAALPAGVNLVAECAPDAPQVLADATQIEQVLINLSTNAWQSTQGRERPGSIEVRLRACECAAGGAQEEGYSLVCGEMRPGRYACVSVKDNGSGMAEDMLTRIFEPFFTTKPVGKGTGLGLAVVHGIVQEHGGSIEVKSVAGEGSTFRVYLPAAQVSGPVVQTRAPRAAAPQGKGMHVLYVDDDESIVLLMTRLLERQGYRVSGYTDAEAALAAVRANPDAFDLAVTDYNMPGRSGLEVARALKEIRADLPIAMASGFITDELREKAPAAGISELIYKPNTVEELSEAVARLAQAAEAIAKSP